MRYCFQTADRGQRARDEITLFGRIGIGLMGCHYLVAALPQLALIRAILWQIGFWLCYKSGDSRLLLPKYEQNLPQLWRNSEFFVSMIGLSTVLKNETNGKLNAHGFKKACGKHACFIEKSDFSLKWIRKQSSTQGRVERIFGPRNVCRDQNARVFPLFFPMTARRAWVNMYLPNWGAMFVGHGGDRIDCIGMM